MQGLPDPSTSFDTFQLTGTKAAKPSGCPQGASASVVHHQGLAFETTGRCPPYQAAGTATRTEAEHSVCPGQLVSPSSAPGMRVCASVTSEQRAAEVPWLEEVGEKRTYKEAFDPLHKKAKQRAKNRKTAKDFRQKMDGLRSYVSNRVHFLNSYVKMLLGIIIAMGPRPQMPNSPSVPRGSVRRSCTSHI